MKIKVSEGCMDTSITIDDRNVELLTVGKIQDALMNVVVKLKREEAIELLMEAVTRFGELGECYCCETCGDTNYEYTMEVPEVWKIEWQDTNF